MHDNDSDDDVSAFTPDDDDLVAYLGWFLFVGGAFLASVFGTLLLAGWLLLR